MGKPRTNNAKELPPEEAARRDRCIEGSNSTGPSSKPASAIWSKSWVRGASSSSKSAAHGDLVWESSVGPEQIAAKDRERAEAAA